MSVIQVNRIIDWVQRKRNRSVLTLQRGKQEKCQGNQMNLNVKETPQREEVK